MANKYYNGVSLPELPSIDTVTYPNIIISKVTADQSYVAWCITDTYIDYYPSSQSLYIDSAATGIIYTLATNATEWVLSNESLSFASYAMHPVTGYEMFFATCDVFDWENYSYFLSSSIPADNYWNWADIDGKVKAIIEFAGEYAPVGVGLYKLVDDVWTYEQALTVTGAAQIEGSFSYGMLFDGSSETDMDIASSPLLVLGALYIVPYDNYVLQMGEDKIIFPEKGIYSTRTIDGVDITSGHTVWNNPTTEAVVLYEGDITTIDSYGFNTTEIMLNEALANRDAILIEYNGVKYYEEVWLDTDNCLWAGEFDPFYGPAFENEPYLFGAWDVGDAYTFVWTQEAITAPLKVVRYMPGSINKLKREVFIENENVTLAAGKTHQIIITSDNASEESPIYEYYCESYYDDIAVVNESGLITAIGEGTAVIYVDSVGTENYHKGSNLIVVTVLPETWYKIKESILNKFADEARRISGTSSLMSTSQMLQVFRNVDSSGGTSGEFELYNYGSALQACDGLTLTNSEYIYGIYEIL